MAFQYIKKRSLEKVSENFLTVKLHSSSWCEALLLLKLVLIPPHFVLTQAITGQVGLWMLNFALPVEKREQVKDAQCAKW